MLSRHIIAVAIAAFGVIVAGGGFAQSPSPDRAEQVRDFLKIDKGQRAVIAFMDFQCPACQKNWPTMKLALAGHPETRFYSVDFPLTHVHQNAFSAAVAYEVAAGAGAGRAAYNDLLSGRQGLEPAQLNAYLQARNLPAVIGTAKAATYESKVKDQLRFAQSCGVVKTPTVLILDERGKLTEVDHLTKLDALLR